MQYVGGRTAGRGPDPRSGEPDGESGNTPESPDAVRVPPSAFAESETPTPVPAYGLGWLHVQFGQNCNKRIAFCRRHCFAPLFAACLTARRVKVGFVHCHDCSGCTNPTGVVGLQSDGE